VRVLILSGPNLNLLGSRDPAVYGTMTLAELEDACRRWGAGLGIEVEAFQSNHEGALIDRIHAAVGAVDGIVFNPGALTHSSYALHDAIEAVPVPVVEVHLSDISRREEWRRISVVRPVCIASIAGKGAEGYREALELLAAREAGAS
jgi:3-dehydroquinate dehydratase-2